MSSKERGTIWVVDDSATDAERVASTLRGEFNVKVFHDGAVALEHLASNEMPDLLLLDWVMPGLSGVEIAAYVRSSPPPVSQLPILLLTAQYGAAEITEAFRSGANDYVVKPFVEDELRARVRTLTSSKRHLARAQSLVKELQRSEERLLLATSSAGVGIWELDIKGGAVTSTDIHRKLFEFNNAGPIAYSALLERIHPEDRGAVERSLSAAIASSSDYSSEFRIQKSDGSIAWIYGHGRAVCDENGEPLRMVGLHLDISERKKNEADLHQAKEEAEKANRMKSAFLANMSHEIRTPLGAMLGFAHLMQDPSISAMELAGHLEVLTRNGEQLSVIINDILDLSKVEAGLLTLEFHEFNPEEIFVDVLSLFKTKAREKNLSLDYVKGPSTEMISTDSTRLRQIVMNLVSNALKFTRSGGIKIESSTTTHASGRKCLLIDVTDTGIGIALEHTDRIFDMFVQADDSTTRKFGGTGIGLTLSRQLARSLGGDLELLKTTPDVGSVFRISILDQPAKSAHRLAQPKIAIDDNEKPISLDGVKVLVVDDAVDNQQLLVHYLSKRGAVVQVASTGLEGYQKALSSSYDIVLMDLQMPQMDGYTATRKLRAEGYKKPIIALTAHAMSEVSASCLEAGCTGYLPKPINPRELVETIAALTL